VPEDQPLTLGTAGHIDHGKTALVAALTGIDTDRLPQEKARGISIELGYAPLELPSGRRLSVVDVPGHERFVRTMVAGATGIDLYLLVVACDDGVMPQTLEHVAILRLLGVRHGVVALTKRDLVDAPTAQAVREQVAELLPGVPAVEVAAPRGDGIEELRARLDDATAAVRSRGGEGVTRLPIDRAFTLRGIGTVVTGTLWSGAVSPGDRLAIEPGALDARVRSVEVHDQAVDRAEAGQRVAVALTGTERSLVRRGQTLLEPGSLAPAYRLECELAVLDAALHALRHGERVTVHHATAELHARVAVRGASAISPGSTGRAQLRLESPVVAAQGDRLIVRLTAPSMTVAGGVVLDPAPTRSGVARPEPASDPVSVAAPVAAPPGTDGLLKRLRAEWLAPAPLTPAERTAAGYLAGHGSAVRAGRDLAFAADAYEAARDEAVDIAGAGSLTIAALRDRLGISRRYAQALLEAMDAEGVTRRVGDARVLRRRSH
jgi:selenocysteine-specific elongation factor